MTIGIGALAKVWLDGYDVSDFFREFAINADKVVHDKTTFGNDGSRAKQTGLKHGVATGVAFSDDTVNTGSWAILSARYGAGVSGLYVWMPYGAAFGSMAHSLYSEEVVFSPQNMVEDLIKITVNAEAKEDAVDLGLVLHGKTAETSLPFTGTGIDSLAATTNGGVGSVHSFAIAGASPNAIVKIQHSTNASVWVDLISFTAITAANTSQRVEVTGTVNRYLRATITEGGTTTSITPGIVFARR